MGSDSLDRGYIWQGLSTELEEQDWKVGLTSMGILGHPASVGKEVGWRGRPEGGRSASQDMTEVAQVRGGKGSGREGWGRDGLLRIRAPGGLPRTS